MDTGACAYLEAEPLEVKKGKISSRPLGQECWVPLGFWWVAACANVGRQVDALGGSP